MFTTVSALVGVADWVAVAAAEVSEMVGSSLLARYLRLQTVWTTSTTHSATGTGHEVTGSSRTHATAAVMPIPAAPNPLSSTREGFREATGSVADSDPLERTSFPAKAKPEHAKMSPKTAYIRRNVAP